MLDGLDCEAVVDNPEKPDIDKDSYKLSSVEKGETNAIFRGGTLEVDHDGRTEQNFFVDDVPGNAIDNNSFAINFSGDFNGGGGLIFKGPGITTLSGENAYKGATVVQEGTLRVTGALGDVTAVDVNAGATYAVENSDTIGSLAGAGSVTLAPGATLTAGAAGSTNYSGVMSGTGGFTKVGSGTMTLSGSNTYSGTTTVEQGTLKAGKANAFSPSSETSVGANGILDLGGVPQTINNLLVKSWGQR